MKNGIIVAVMAAVVGIGSYVMGTTQTETVIETQIVTEIHEEEKVIEDIPDNYIDMCKVIDFSTTENGLYLYTQDGNGYYWEK